MNSGTEDKAGPRGAFSGQLATQKALLGLERAQASEAATAWAIGGRFCPCATVELGDLARAARTLEAELTPAQFAALAEEVTTRAEQILAEQGVADLAFSALWEATRELLPHAEFSPRPDK